MSDGTTNALKRLSDIILASIALVMLAPMFAVIALLSKLDSRGPVFYKSERVGKDGNPFIPYKFRTMVAGADKIGPSATVADDPRITRVGRILRRFNMDELPQFLNVLRGEMSIVGPRPQVPWAVALYTDEEREVLTVQPGITDWATVWISNQDERLRGSADPEKEYMERIWPEKRRLQLDYVRNHSLWMDFEIMAMTLKVHLLDRIKVYLVDSISKQGKGVM